MDHLDELRLSCAAKIAALADALRDIQPDLAPCPRASLVAVREQIYFGWEHPLAHAEGKVLLFERVRARQLVVQGCGRASVQSGGVTRGNRLLERDHVEPISGDECTIS